MNFKQLQYAVLLSEIGNFSAVAEKLDISQPALSKQILNLEKEIGIQLFNRHSSSAILTAAGEHFIKEAKELIYKEEQLHHSMQMYAAGEKGKLIIGATPFRSSYLIPKIAKELRKKFPGVQIQIAEEGNEVLKKEAAEGKFDLAIVNLPVDEPLFDITPIDADKLALVISDDLLKDYPALQNKKSTDFKECKDLSFVVVGQNQEMRKLFENLCIDSGIHPDIAAEVVSLTTAWNMASYGVGATILPMQFIDNESLDKIKVLEIKGTSKLRQPAIITRKGQYLSEHAKYAISLLVK